MDILEENPLNTYTDTIKVSPNTFRNCAGRPSNTKVIKFSQQSKSVVAHMIIEEQKLLADKKTEVLSFPITETAENGLELRVMQKSKINSEKGLKIFSCTYENCTYSTQISSNLTKHKRIHSNDKLYLCDECTFSTKFSNSLNVHKRLHSNEKPFFCQYCQYRCNSSSNLKKHYNHKHLDKS